MPQEPLVNIEIEKKLLALAVQHSEAALAVQKGGGKELFNGNFNRQIWGAIEQLLDHKTPIQYLLVRDILDAKRGPKAHRLDKLMQEHADIPLADAHVYVPILADYAERRRLAIVAAQFTNGVFDLTTHTAQVKGLLQSSLDAKSLVQVEANRALFDDLPKISDQLKAYKDADQSIIFPFEGVGKITGALKPGDFILLAARPSMGKTTFAINVASFIARTKPVLFFSLEMGAEQIGLKVLASELDLTHSEIQEDAALEWMREPTGPIAPLLRNLYVYDGIKGDVDSLKSVVYDFVSMGKAPGLIVVDYIQLMGSRHQEEGKDSSREREVSIVSRNLKLLAKEIKAPILALSQLNRQVEQRANKTPVLSDLRDSGSLEQDADLVVFLFREEYYKKGAVPGLTEVLILKNRMGPTGMTSIYLEAEKSRFYEGA